MTKGRSVMAACGQLGNVELREKRRALRVVIDDELGTDATMNDLMGKDAQPRYQFIMEHAGTASAEELDL